jgi:hypothetical protein
MIEKIREFTLVTKAASSFLKLILLVIVVFVLVWQLMGRGNDQTAQIASVSSAFGVVDALNVVPVDVNISNNVETFEVYKMPEFVLSLPNKDLFSYEKMQLIAFNLGFTNNAEVMNFGQQVAYQEGAMMITFDQKMGQMDFSTAFNYGETVLPDSKPTADLVKEAVKDFINDNELPADFLDLDAMITEYMYLDSLGTITPALVSDGPLMKVTIPYQVSGVRMILPIESYAVIDGGGTIRLITLMLPDITQTDRTLTLRSWGSAKKAAEEGKAAVIDYKLTRTTDFMISSSYPAYYLNQSSYYSLDTLRVMQPIYVFDGENGRVAVLAQVQ